MEKQKHQTAFNNIDDAAERARIRFYTSRLNHMIIYIEKTNEAIEYLAEINPNVHNYPLINAEVDATGQDPRQIAQTILKRRNEWIQMCTYIEQIRLNGKYHVRKLDDEHEIRQSCERTVAALDRLNPDRQ